MEANPAERAVARWLAHGATSTTHPLLREALAGYLHPVGIEADWLEAEPFGGLTAGDAEGWLRNPRWNPARVDPGHPGAANLRAHAAQAAEARVDTAGALHLPRDGADTWPAERECVRAAARAGAFIHAAAALILADPAAAALYADGDDAAFASLVRRRLAAGAAAETGASQAIPAET